MSLPVPVRSTSSVPSGLLGRTEPRFFTPPLVELTPDTSYGFDVIEFADKVCRRPLDPWQQWAVVHGGELLPDGRPRFRTLLIIVARQNGKTELLVILSLYWLFVEVQRLVLGTSTNLAYAVESWEKAIDLAESSPDLAPLVELVRRKNGEETLRTVEGCRYRVAASNRKGGRSLTINRLVLDELREHRDWSAWNAAVPAMNAVPDAQAIAITNQGDDESVVLNSLRDSALQFIESGEGDERLGLIEYSAPDGSKPTDPDALCMANPNAGRRIDLGSLLGAARRAETNGGAELSGFLTEVQCRRVRQLDPAIDPEKWAGCLDPGDLADVRDRVALAVDLSIDGQHATLVAAAVLPDGRVRVEPVAAYEGTQAADQLRRNLPRQVERVKPRVLGWLPAGPAAQVAVDIATERRNWPPSGVKVESITSELTQVAMGFASLVTAKQIAHSDDPLLNGQVAGAEKVRRGDAWVFGRRGAAHVDGLYAAAAATHLARTLPPPPRRVKVLRPRDAA